VHRLTPLLVALLAVTVVGVSGAAGPAPVVKTPTACVVDLWPQPRQNPCASGGPLGSDASKAPSPDTVGRLRRAWVVKVGKSVGQPIVTAGGGLDEPTVILGSDVGLVALDLAAGRLRWKAKSGGSPSDGTQPIADGAVLLRISYEEPGDANPNDEPWPKLRRYAPATGTILWAKDVQVENYLQRQVVADGNWYMQDPFQLYVYDERTGSERWGLGVECGNCGPAAGGGRVYLAGRFESGGSGSGTKLAALDARTGRTAWSVPVDGDASFGSWPVLANGIVYLRTMTRRNLGDDKFEDSFWIEAHRATDGKLVWRSGVGKSVGSWLSPIAVGSGIVVYPSEDGRLHAIDAASGTPRWTMPGNDRNVRPAIANGLVWTGDSADRLVALDARDGRRRWASPPFPPDGPVSPVLAGGTLLVGDPKTARLFAYRVGG